MRGGYGDRSQRGGGSGVGSNCGYEWLKSNHCGYYDGDGHNGGSVRRSCFHWDSHGSDCCAWDEYDPISNHGFRAGGDTFNGLFGDHKRHKRISGNGLLYGLLSQSGWIGRGECK